MHQVWAAARETAQSWEKQITDSNVNKRKQARQRGEEVFVLAENWSVHEALCVSQGTEAERSLLIWKNGIAPTGKSLTSEAEQIFNPRWHKNILQRTILLLGRRWAPKLERAEV